LRGEALDAVFEFVATCEARVVRRALLDRLERLGPHVATIAARHLDDNRWFVVRNMLMLIAEVKERPAGIDVKRFLSHPDPRVRFEALRVATGRPDDAAEAIATVLANERDPRVLWQALSELREYCPAWCVVPLEQVVLDASLAENLRVVAVRVLGLCKERAALDVLLEMSHAGPQTSDRIAAEALRGLAQGWPNDARARQAVSRASSWFRPRPRPRGTTRVS
jgi:HEAT repeat protein